MASNSGSGMNLRLLVNNKSSKILYAEAGKDFVDLLFSFLTLPTGSVIKLLSTLKRAKRIGCLTNLYNSVDNLQIMFMNAEKSHLLEPKIMSTYSNDILRLDCAPSVYYVCGSQYSSGGSTHYLSTKSGDRCACGNPMHFNVQLQKPSDGDNSTNVAGSSGGGYVKETVTFIITDDLQISPSSTITSLNRLNKLNVKDLTDLVERNASVGPNEALELLWASLASTTPLNDVFGATV